jgi:hypothetical protein
MFWLFINLIFLLLFWPSLASYPQKFFLAFTDGLEKIRREVTGKGATSFLFDRGLREHRRAGQPMKTEGNEGNEDSVQATEQRPLHSLPRAAIAGAAQNVNAVFSM